MAAKPAIPEVDLSLKNEAFLFELNDPTEMLFNRHLQNPRTFYPHDFSYTPTPQEELDPSSQIPYAAKVSLLVNLVTEEGLPYYTTVLDRPIPAKSKYAFREWLHRWTAEEGRHAPTISNYMNSTGQIRMHLVEDARMAMMSSPDTPQPASVIEGIVYPAFQEPATWVAHSNTMKQLPRSHRLGRKALGYVIGDEAKHGDFYADLTSYALEIDPSSTVIAIAKQVKGFGMPGKSTPGFTDYAEIIDEAGIFGGTDMLDIYDRMITKKWNIWEINNLSSDAEKARDYLRSYLEKLPILIAKKAERRDIKRIITRVKERGLDPSTSADPFLVQ